MPIENYEQALRYWHSRVDYEKTGMPGDLRTLNLGCMRRLLEELGQPHERLAVIHIAGTKGKGSTAALLAAVLQAAGLRTGLFTSPHLERVEERIQVQGAPIAPADLTRQMQRVEVAATASEAAGFGPPTFFEIMTALGLHHFADQQVDLAVLETGLGGRFDATNVCRPLLTLITNISFDHVTQLGPGLADIAWAKAGIIKPGCPVISGATAPEARLVIRWVAEHLGAPLFELGRDFTFEAEPGRLVAGQWPRVRLQGAPADPWLELRLWGDHQAANAALVLEAVALLRSQGVAVPPEAVAAGFRQVVWPGRLEVVSRAPWVVLDCAHNPASMAATVSWLLAQVPAPRRHLILALSRDKELAPTLEPLVPHFAQAHFTRYASSARSADPRRLAELWQELGGGPAMVHENTGSAWAAVEGDLANEPQAAVLVTGSVFLAGELRARLRAAGKGR